MKNLGNLGFYNLAKEILKLDLVISSDTSILHLSSSIGIKTYGLLGYRADWRWLDDDSLKITTCSLPAIRVLPNGISVFFNQLIAAFTDKEIGIVTLCKRIEKADVLVDNSKPKVKFDDNKKATSFERVINSPFEDGVFYKHIGIYAYRLNVLEKVCDLKPSSLEIKHKLEQWRWLQNGYDILVLETPFDSYSVDTPEDLKKIIERFGDSN